MASDGGKRHVQESTPTAERSGLVREVLASFGERLAAKRLYVTPSAPESKLSRGLKRIARLMLPDGEPLLSPSMMRACKRTRD